VLSRLPDVVEDEPVVAKELAERPSMAVWEYAGTPESRARTTSSSESLQLRWTMYTGALAISASAMARCTPSASAFVGRVRA